MTGLSKTIGRDITSRLVVNWTQEWSQQTLYPLVIVSGNDVFAAKATIITIIIILPEEDSAMSSEPSDAAATKPVCGRPQMDMNMYATRKTIAQDVLLNASQHKYLEVTIALITLSIILQIIVGIVFILLGRLNINFFIDRKRADFLNNASVILIFLITVVNVLITAFGPTVSHAGGGHPTAWTNFYPGKLPDDNK